MRVSLIFAASAASILLPFAAQAEAPSKEIIVTATRAPEPAIDIPVVITVIDGDDIAKQGAFDLRGALAAAGGVQVNPGGDNGPAGSVVALQGLAEMDAYLLVVDGVPYGGAFNPATPTLDLIDVDRIEVLRGAAPITYGSTSFVGVLNIIRHLPGEQPTRAIIQGGTRSSGRAAFATNLPSLGKLDQSALGSFETRRFSQDRGGFDRGHLLYRAGAKAGEGRVHFDLDLTTLDQTPYSPHPREGNFLSPRFPLDTNVNPGDARIDQDRVQANLGFDSKIGTLDWVTLISASTTRGRLVRGFIRDGFTTNGLSINADGFRQKVRTTDVYFDTHVDYEADKFDFVTGVDLLYGRGRQRSANFEYAVRIDGSNAPRSTALPIDESTALKDRRIFAGLYAQTVIRPVTPLTLLIGGRLNRTDERRCGAELPGNARPNPNICTKRQKTRFIGSAGATYALYRKGDNTLAVFGDYRTSYKPAAIDFGPESDPRILEPESSRGWEAGLKGELADGRFEFEASYFDTRFRNLVIRENIDGLPALANAGRERFRGFELEATVRPVKDVSLTGSYARHLARFTDFARLRPNGSIQQLAGNRLELSPKDLAAAVATYAPETGPQASATVRYVGSRFLNKGNTALAKDYTTLDGRIGWKLKNKFGLFLEAENLTNQRDAVAESEIGDAQFYRLPGRRIFATLSYGY
jgi:iron complex outermembrane recepter protein